MTRSTQRIGHVDTFGCSRSASTDVDHYLVAELERTARVQHGGHAQPDESECYGANQAYALLVSDGALGVPGAATSRLVVDEVLQSMLTSIPWAPELDLDIEAGIRRALKQILVRCNRQLGELDGNAPGPRRSEVSATLAFVRWPHLFVVHAGDGKAYLLRRGRLTELTCPPGDDDPSRATELTTHDLQPDDRVLVCSAGLAQRLDEGAIAGIVDNARDARAASEALVGAARDVAGGEHATVTLAHFRPLVTDRASAVERPRAGGPGQRRPIPRTVERVVVEPRSATAGRRTSAIATTDKAPITTHDA